MPPCNPTSSRCGNVSKWARVCASSDDLAADTTDAVAAAVGPPGGIATLVVPADVSWGPVAGASARQRPVPPVGSVPAGTIESVRKVLYLEEPVVVLLGGRALRDRGLRAAASIAEATGAKLLAETFPARLERGGGLPPVQRLAYLGEMAIGQLAPARHIVLVDTPAPVSFFAYPGQPSELWPTGCELHVLAGPEHDVTGALEALAVCVRPSGSSETCGISGRRPLPVRPTGSLTSESLAAAIAYVLPEGAVVVDESNTAGVFLPGATERVPRHDWLCNSGGAIGQGLPVATGAAIGAPDRPVICVQADGSAMYTLQALWTQAREEPRRDHRRPLEPRLCHLEPGAGTRGRRSQGAPGGAPARTVEPRPRLRRSGPRNGRTGYVGHHGRRAGRSVATRAARARPTPGRGCPSDRARMTAGARHDLSTERAVVPGHIRRPLPLPQHGWACHTTHEWTADRDRELNVDD